MKEIIEFLAGSFLYMLAFIVFLFALGLALSVVSGGPLVWFGLYSAYAVYRMRKNHKEGRTLFDWKNNRWEGIKK